MPENEFDKQVRKMMDDLKLKPSDAVWPLVEKRIREKKRRKRALIFLPLLAGIMLLGYSGIHYFNSMANNKRSKASDGNETNKINDKKASIPFKQSNASEKNKIGIQKDRITKENSSIKNYIPSKFKIRKYSGSEKGPISKNYFSSNRKISENFHTPQLKDENENHVITPYEDKSEKADNPSHDISSQKIENKIAVKSGASGIKVKSDSSQIQELTNVKSADSNQVREVTDIKSANDSAISKIQQRDKKLIWGFHFSTGISGTRSNLFQLNQNKSLNYAASQNSASSGNTYGRLIPNSARSGIAFQAGMLVEKRLSRRSSLDLGIQYGYYSDHIKVGSRTDSVIRIVNYYSADLVVSGFYMNTSTNNYINHYHFIELPLNHHFLLIDKQNPFSWDFGISIGQLLSTNTLVFDTANQGVYYTAKKLFRKTQANLTTGFSITFNQHKAVQWVICPKVQFGLINLNKGYTDKKAYPFFAGVDLRLMLPKK